MVVIWITCAALRGIDCPSPARTERQVRAGINNWNEEQKKIETIQVYLQNLADDIRDDLVNYARNETSSTFRYYSAQYLLQLAEEPLYNPTPDEHVVEKWK